MARSRSVSLWSARSLLRLLLLSLLCAALVRESEANCDIISAGSLVAVCRIGTSFYAYYRVPFTCTQIAYTVNAATAVGQCSLKRPQTSGICTRITSRLTTSHRTAARAQPAPP